MTNLNKWVVALGILAIAWGFAGSYWYTCNIKNVCSPISPISVAKNETPPPVIEKVAEVPVIEETPEPIVEEPIIAEVPVIKETPEPVVEEPIIAEEPILEETPEPLVELSKLDLRFSNGKATPILNDEAKTLIESYAERSNLENKTIHITGFTDSLGSASLNMALGLQRAKSVEQILLQAGAKAENVKTYSQGMGSPIASNRTRAGRAKNRRVSVVLTD